MKDYILIFSLLVLCLISKAQDPVYKSIDKTLGLPSNTIYDILQDDDGFIWIGHDKGISKYDGFRFKHYQNEEQRGRPLSNLMQDSTGKVWCQNFIGQFFFIENDTLKLCEPLKPSGIYIPSTILNGNILVTVGENGFRYLHCNTLQLKEKVLDNFTSNHYTYPTNKLYYFYNKISGHLISTDAEGNFHSEDAPSRTSYFFPVPLKHSTYYVPKYPDDKVGLLDMQKQEQVYTFPDKTFIQNTRVLNDSLMAIMTSTGFYLFEENSSTTSLKSKHYFHDKNTSCIARDKEGNWWIGTLNEGVLFIPNLGTLRSFENQSFTAIAANKRANSLYLGTAHNQVLEYTLSNRNLRTVFSNKINQEIITIFYDSASEALGYSSNNVFIFPKNKKAIIQDGSIKDITQLDKNHFVVAASGFIGLLGDGKKQNRTRWHEAYKDIGSYIGEDSIQFRLNSGELRARASILLKDTLYVATTGGLMAYTLNGPIEIKHDDKSVIVSDLEIYKNAVYAVSFNKGLLKVENGRLIKYFHPDQNGIAGIYKLKIVGGIAWMLTESNLIAFSLKDKKVKLIDQTSGLPMDDLRDFTIMNDTVYMVGNKGLVFFPARLPDNSEIHPGLVINSFIVNQKKKYLKNNIVLSSNENDIEIDYSVIAYKTGNDVSVEYSINDSEWRLLEKNNRELRLASLSPGHYKVGLRASYDHGMYAEQTVLAFTIAKPFYLQFWFIVFSLITLFTLVYLLYKQRLAKIRYQNKLETDRLHLEQALQQSLLASIKAQMNPHFIYNSLSSIHAFVYSDDKANAIKYLDRFSELTRKVLELSGHESILLSEEIELLETYISLEKMRFGETLHSNITCAEELDVHFVRLPSMIIQPFVENAIKHGLLHRKGLKQLQINFTREGDNLLVTIEDNGVGRKNSNELKSNKNKNHTSFSISANKKRLELLNAKKKDSIGLQIVDKIDEMGRGSGTKVIINIPTQFS